MPERGAKSRDRAAAGHLHGVHPAALRGQAGSERRVVSVGGGVEQTVRAFETLIKLLRQLHVFSWYGIKLLYQAFYLSFYFINFVHQTDSSD